jgi:preprotein translocase subunit SecE
MNLVTYLNETISELKLVRWPTRRETINLTLIVIAISVVVGAYVGGLDFIFTNILKLISNK